MSIRYSLDRALVLCAVLFSCTVIHAKECGFKPMKLGITNGTNALENEFPWQVSWRFYDHYSETHQHFCGASILSDNWLLTAAHCVDLGNDVSKIDEKNFRAMVGAHSQSKPSINQQVIEVKKIHVHPNWNSKALLNDVALIELSRPIGLDKTNLNAICLGRPDHQVEGKSAVISGWGYTSELIKEVPDILRRGTVKVEYQNACKHIYGSLTPQNVCAGKSTGGCNGDSGGPLQYEIDGRWYQLGVASWVVHCGSSIYPTVFVRVPYFLDFIEKITGLTPP